MGQFTHIQSIHINNTPDKSTDCLKRGRHKKGNNYVQMIH